MATALWRSSRWWQVTGHHIVALWVTDDARKPLGDTTPPHQVGLWLIMTEDNLEFDFCYFYFEIDTTLLKHFYNFRSSRQDLQWIWRDKGYILIYLQTIRKICDSYRCRCLCWSVWFDLQMFACGQTQWLSWLWGCFSSRSSSLTLWWPFLLWLSGKRMSLIWNKLPSVAK